MNSSPPEAASKTRRRQHWLLAGSLAILGTSLVAIVPGFASALRVPAAELQPAMLSMTLALPPLSSRDQSRVGTGWQFVRVRSGQTLGTIFADLGLSATLMQRLLDASTAKATLSHLRDGQELAFELDGSGQLRTLRFDKSLEERISLHIDHDVIRERIVSRPVERRIEIGAGTITSSLYADGARAGLTNGAINDMANIFKYDIDFVEDVRDGDTFQVVYEELWREGQRIGTGVKMFAKVRDTNTDLLAEKFVAALEKQLGGKVWFVIARCERRFVDFNRPREASYENV